MSRINNLRYVLCLFLVTMSLTALAQSPGYLGKKTSVQFNLATSPRLFSANANNKGGDLRYGQTSEVGIGLNSKYGLSINRAVSRSVSWSFSADYSLLGYYGSFETDTYEDDHSNIYGSTDVHKCFLNAQVMEYALGLRLYSLKRGSLAPMGTYFMPKLGIARSRNKIIDRYTDYGEYSLLDKINPLELEETIQHFLFGFGVGNSQIIKDRFVLNASLECVFYIPTDIILGDDSGSYNYDLQKDALTNRMNNQSIFMFRLGIGYLF